MALALLLIPIAFAANIVRVMILVLVTYHFGDEAGQGFVHGFAGMVLFMVALVLMLVVDKLLGLVLAQRKVEAVMTSVRIKALVALVIMMLAFAGAHAWKPTRHLSDMRPAVDLETMFPKSFDGWVVDTRVPVQLVSPDVAAVLNRTYNQTLSRTYVNRSGERIMLSVAYGGDQSDGTRAHRPEVCYPAQGFQILSSEMRELDAPPSPSRVRQLVAKLGGRVEPITYWVVVGDRIALSGTEQKIEQLTYSVKGVIPDGMLVRVSSIDRDSARAFKVQDSFIASLAKALRGGDLPQVMGSAGT